MKPSTKIIEKESGGDDAFARAARTEPAPLKSKYVSSRTVAVGEGVKFSVDSLEVVADRFADDEGKVAEITGTVIENRATGLVDDEITVTCKAVRLEQLANDVGLYTVPGAVVTLVRGDDEGKAVGWRWTIEEPAS